MSVRKIIGLGAIAASLLGANVASAQYLANGCTVPPNVYFENGACVPFYPYPGHGQVINGQTVATSTGSVLGASTTIPNLPNGLSSVSATSAVGQTGTLITISDTAIMPSVLIVSPGTTVTWRNTGTVGRYLQSDPNNATSVLGSWSSGLIPPGGTFARVFSDGGTFLYHDTVGGMNGAVIVSPNAAPVASSVLGASTNVPNIPGTSFNAAAVGQRVAQVSIFDNFFDPSTVIIDQGSTVTWTNKGSSNHSVVGDNGAFSSGMLAPNGSYSHIFNVTGTYGYRDGNSNSFGEVVVIRPGQRIGTVLGASTTLPNVPNTGAGGDAAVNFLILSLAALGVLGSAFVLRKRVFSSV